MKYILALLLVTPYTLECMQTNPSKPQLIKEQGIKIMIELFEKTNGQADLEKPIGSTYRVYGEHKPDTISQYIGRIASNIWWPWCTRYTRYLAQDNIGDTIGDHAIVFSDTLEVDEDWGEGHISGSAWIVNKKDNVFPHFDLLNYNKNQISIFLKHVAIRLTRTKVDVSYRDWTKKPDESGYLQEPYPYSSNSLIPLALIPVYEDDIITNDHTTYPPYMRYFHSR